MRIGDAIRDITDDEVEFYLENGWVRLPGLVAPELVSAMLEVFTRRSAEREPAERESSSTWGWGQVWREVELFRDFVFSEKLGRAAQRLMNRTRLNDDDIAVRYRYDLLISKPPGAKGHPYHQDSCQHGGDRVGEMQWWLALDEVTPAMGAIRFLTGSHREGPLGAVLADDKDLIAYYPKLEELYEWSPPLSYRPGDATIHDGYMIHGGPDNTSDRTRWGYIFSYTPADKRMWDGIEGNGGDARRPLSDADNPIVVGRPLSARA